MAVFCFNNFPVWFILVSWFLPPLGGKPKPKPNQSNLSTGLPLMCASCPSGAGFCFKLPLDFYFIYGTIYTVNKVNGGYMKLHQKKFYSSPEVDKIVEQHAKEKGYGYSEALRHIVMSWAGELVTIPKVDQEYWKTEAGIEQSR